MDYRNYAGFERFEAGINDLGIHLQDIQKQQFITFYKLLVKWNEVMNLTAITDFTQVLEKHFLDSLSIVKVLTPDKETILDMGTGAGFPGIPIKIAFPGTRITLLDSLNKRINFLNEVIGQLGLTNIEAVHGRSEDLGQNKKYRENYDICVSRAVAKLSSLSEYCLPFVKTGGCFIPYKSGSIEEELEMSRKALQVLGASVEATSSFTLPGTDMERTLLLIRKTKITPARYPRSAGKPTKEPL